MRYVNKFDYIVENVAQARAILSKKNISYDNPIFQRILSTTKRDGYTGLITKLVFELPLGVDSALRLYDTMKEAKLDVGDSHIKKILEDGDIADTKKVSLIITYIQDQWRKLKKSFDYLFTDSNYRVYLINKYEGILATASPAWCLKTKSMFDSYTTKQGGTQFVIIQERFVTKDGEILLTVPNTWNERYESGSYAKMRFGITIYPSERMIIFDDNNLQIDCYQNQLTDPRYDFLKPLLSKLLEYYRQNIKKNISVTDVEYDEFKDAVFDIMDSLGMTDSFSEIAPNHNKYDVDDQFEEFYESVRDEMGLDKEQLFDVLGKFQAQIMMDEKWTQENGYRDLLVNFMLTKNQISVPLENIPNITAHEIPLGGYFFSEQEIGDSVIKYYYGYQYTKYGKAGIEQGFGNVENFYEEISKAFVDLFIGDDTYLALDMVERSSVKIGMGPFKERVQECMKNEKYKDGKKIIIDVPKLLELFKSLNINYSNYDVELRRSVTQYYRDFNEKEFIKKILDTVKPYFKGTEKKSDSEVIVPICTV